MFLGMVRAVVKWLGNLGVVMNEVRHCYAAWQQLQSTTEGYDTGVAAIDFFSHFAANWCANNNRQNVNDEAKMRDARTESFVTLMHTLLNLRMLDANFLALAQIFHFISHGANLTRVTWNGCESLMYPGTISVELPISTVGLPISQNSILMIITSSILIIATHYRSSFSREWTWK